MIGEYNGLRPSGVISVPATRGDGFRVAGPRFHSRRTMMSGTMDAEAQLWLLHDSSAPGNLVTVTEPHGRWFMWFAEDSPLEGDGFELSLKIRLEENCGFP